MGRLFGAVKDLQTCSESVKETGLPVYIYGMGSGGEKVLAWCREHGIEVRGVFASDGFVRGQSFCGYRVMTLREAEEREGRLTVLLAFGSELKEVMAKVESIENRHPLFAPDTAVIGSGFFDREELFKNIDRAEKALELFEDGLSQKTFIGLTAFKLTGRLSFLREIFCDEKKPSPLLELGKEEVCCDLGAYNGDTVSGFVRAAGGYKKIYAMEPEKRNFQKLVRNTAGLDDIELINCAAWAYDTTLAMEGGSGRQARLTPQTGDLAAGIAARSLDSVLCGRECTYIKYDVEGADIPALEGSAGTIKRYRPKLCCALYHRCYDYIDIPLYISERFGYKKFFIRQAPYYPAWETELYAVH